VLTGIRERVSGPVLKEPSVAKAVVQNAAERMPIAIVSY
jgi:hypothetical protein